MYCRNCGAKIDDNAYFCGVCGTKVNEAFSNSNKSTVYSVYENFDNSHSGASLGVKAIDKIFKKSYDEQFISKFAITDRSIIIDGIEHPFEQMTVLYPTGDFQFNIFPDEDRTYYGTIENKIDGKTYTFNYPKKERLRFFYSAVKANEHIKLSSNRQELQCILMMYAFLSAADNIISKNPHINFDENPTYDEIKGFDKRIIVNQDTQINELERKIISEYNYVQEKLNDFYKNTNAIPDQGSNRVPMILASIVRFMTDSDENPQNAIKMHNQKIQDEQERRERERQESIERSQSGYYDESSNSSGSGFLGDVIKTAAGVAIGNKISQRRSSNIKPKSQPQKKVRYYCPLSCPKRGKDYGPTRCKLNPATCGNGKTWS